MPRLTAVCFRESNGEELVWVAQILEYDLATHAPKLDAMIGALAYMLEGHKAICKAENVGPFDIPEAPERYRRMIHDPDVLTLAFDSSFFARK